MNWQYVAGFVDGEGSINVSNHGKQLSLTIAQKTDQSFVLDVIGEFFHEHGIAFSEDGRVNNTGCHYRRITVGQQAGLKKLLVKLLPFSIVKRGDIEAGLEFLLAQADARNRRQAACKYGHRRTKANTYTSPRGRKSCLVCRRLRANGEQPTLSVPGYTRD